MWMNDEDICREYKEAKDKKKQIEILADQNLCNTKRIEAILAKNGMLEQKPERKRRNIIKKDIPTGVKEALFKKLDALDEEIKRVTKEKERLTKEYKEIATFIEG